MKKALVNLIASLVAALVCVLPATACINDGTTLQKEKEFKSQYQDQQESPGQDNGAIDVVAWGATGTGAVLLIGAVAVMLPKRMRPRQ
jgi:hypothetical protein